MSYQDKSISEELVIFMFNHEKLQRANELEQIILDENEIIRFYKNLSRSGGWLTTQPINGVYQMLCSYETTTILAEGTRYKHDVKEAFDILEVYETEIRAGRMGNRIF